VQLMAAQHSLAHLSFGHGGRGVTTNDSVTKSRGFWFVCLFAKAGHSG